MNTAFVLIDLQEKFEPHIHKFKEIKNNCKILVKASKILNIPLIVTEQVPEKLGKTVIEIPASYEKIEFSCFGNETIRGELDRYDRLILFGIESHVCVFQTAFDGKKAEKEVEVVIDAISSRKKSDKKIALERFKQEQVKLTTTEMVLFQLLKKAGTKEFKEISRLIK